MTASLITSGAVLAGVMVFLWLVSLVADDVSIVDMFWGAGFALVAWLGLLVADGITLHRVLVVAAVTVWGLRLAGYLAWRNLGKGEDYRYRRMRERAGPRFRYTSLVIIFGFQGALIWVVSLPVQVGLAADPAGDRFTAMHAVGLVLWLVGLLFETVGDLQLARFKADPANRGQVMDRGLWRYTRHPNYFGDFTVWWGLFALSMATPAGLLAHGWTVIGPALMSLLLLRVSGVTLLESALRTRRPGYEEYIRRTSAFFPWPPRA